MNLSGWRTFIPEMEMTSTDEERDVVALSAREHKLASTKGLRTRIVQLCWQYTDGTTGLVWVTQQQFNDIIAAEAWLELRPGALVPMGYPP